MCRAAPTRPSRPKQHFQSLSVSLPYALHPYMGALRQYRDERYIRLLIDAVLPCRIFYQTRAAAIIAASPLGLLKAKHTTAVVAVGKTASLSKRELRAPHAHRAHPKRTVSNHRSHLRTVSPPLPLPPPSFPSPPVASLPLKSPSSPPAVAT